MNPTVVRVLCAVVSLTLLSTKTNFAADQISLDFKYGPTQVEIGVHGKLALPVSGMFPEYTIERSTDLLTWQPVAGPISGSVGVSDEFLRLTTPLAGEHAFYRVAANIKLAPAESRNGEAIFGYATEFSRQLQRIGQLSLADFTARYAPTNEYLPGISFDPTAAEFWDQFNLNPAVHNATNPTDPRLTDFRLNPAEFAVFQTNGFVVSQRLGTYSFADAFYKIYIDDLPVFFSADAALHAWHRTYISMLEELEETFLSPTLQQILDGMALQVPALWNASQITGMAMTNGILDTDYFLAVARSLVTGTTNNGSLGQRSRITNTLAAITRLQPAEINLFGANRLVDFSQFQVRGHYDTSERLRKYFRATMWCGFIDFRFTGSTNDNSLRELSGAIAMNMLMTMSGQFTNWQQLDNVVQMFVGLPDSLNFAQLSDLLAAANVQSPANIPDVAALANLQTQFMSGHVGVQNIRSGYFFSPFSAEQIKLPRSFTVMGQRFILDGWAHSKCVFDDIIWDEDGIPGREDKVRRRVPSALDVAFSVFGNSQIVPEITARIANPNGHPWRDGYPYQHNLAAVREVVDKQDAGSWTNNIYTFWLACLRELSAPTTGGEYPQAMRTRPWAMKTLNTQLASWTELRHDTVLYAKQPYTGITTCSYPDGFVEPRPAFWSRMRDMALRTKELMATLPQSGSFVFEPNAPGIGSFSYSLGAIYANRLNTLTFFGATMDNLRAISEKELRREVLASNETVFVQSLIEDRILQGYSPIKTFTGWYPSLFYFSARARNSGVAGAVVNRSSEMWDALVTDVHTDPSGDDSGDPGSILHEAVGNIHMLMIAVDCGDGDRAVYAGPVMSHYEFEKGPTTRMTDAQWKTEVSAGRLPPQPDWTRGYLVPATNSLPAGF